MQEALHWACPNWTTGIPKQWKFSLFAVNVIKCYLWPKTYIRLPFLTFKNYTRLSVRNFLKTQFYLHKLIRTSVGRILKWLFFAKDRYCFMITSHELKKIAMVTSMSPREVKTEQKYVRGDWVVYVEQAIKKVWQR